jgi:hypothetical protein
MDDIRKVSGYHPYQQVIQKVSGYHPYQQVIQKVSGYSLVDTQKLS